MKYLSAEGHALRQRLADVGVEVTPDQLCDAVIEAADRVAPGPDGKCVQCRKGYDEPCADGRSRDFRFGLCDECAFPPRPPLTEAQRAEVDDFVATLATRPSHSEGR